MTVTNRSLPFLQNGRMGSSDQQHPKLKQADPSAIRLLAILVQEGGF